MKVPNFQNTWYFTELAHVDMNGSFPTWIINKIMGGKCEEEVGHFYEGMKDLNCLK